MNRPYLILLYISPLIILTVALSPIMYVMVLMSAMASDSGSAAAGSIAMSITASVAVGAVGCLGYAIYSYVNKNYTAAIGWSIPNSIILTLIFLLFSHKFFVIFLWLGWLALGYPLYLKSKHDKREGQRS